jgi:hypothetical protein
LAIKAEDVQQVTLSFAGMDLATWQEKRTAYLTEASREQAEREKEREQDRQRYQERETRVKAEIAAIAPQLAPYQESQDLKAGILVRVSTTEASFIFYRYVGPGSFGRVKWQTATSSKLNLQDLVWKDRTQESYNELTKRLKGTRLLQTNAGKTTPRVPSKVLATINY